MTEAHLQLRELVLRVSLLETIVDSLLTAKLRDGADPIAALEQLHADALKALHAPPAEPESETVADLRLAKIVCTDQYFRDLRSLLSRKSGANDGR